MGSNRLGVGLQHTHLQPQEATLLYAIVHAKTPPMPRRSGASPAPFARVVSSTVAISS